MDEFGARSYLGPHPAGLLLALSYSVALMLSAERGGAPRPSITVAGKSAPGIAAATVAMVVWGFSGVLVVLTKLPALVVALERMWLGVPFIALLLAVTRRRLAWSVLWRSVPGGVLLCGDIALFFTAVKMTSIADASLIGALQPALVLFVAGPLFGERVTGATVAWTACAIAGVAAVVLGAGHTGRSELVGDSLAFGSLCCWTGYWLVSKRARAVPQTMAGNSTGAAKPLGSIEYTSAVLLVAAVAMAPVTLLSGEHVTTGTAVDWLWMLIMVLGPGGVAHLMSNWAHRFVDVSVSSVIVSVSPVVAAASATVVLGQSLNVVEVTGGLVAVLAVSVVAHQAARSGLVATEAP
jgi:drug/metabolite transporter (DMT)-like permease